MNRGRAAALALPWLLLAIHAWLWQGFFVDDPYISFRYARNLVRGEGLVFNPGERVEGLSNIGWTLLAAAFEWIRPTPTGAPRSPAETPLVLLSFACATILLWRTRVAGPARHTDTDWLAPALLAAAPYMALWSWSALEPIPWALALWLTWEGLAHRAPRRFLAGLLLTTFLRFDGLLFACLGAGAALLQRDDRRALRAALITWAIAALALHLWRIAYFGEAVPNVIRAKSGGELTSRLYAGVRYMGAFVATCGWPGVVAALACVAARGRGLAPAPVYAAGCAAFVVVECLASGGDWMPGARFLVPLFLFASAYAPFGVQQLESVGTRRWISAGLVAATLAGTLWVPQIWVWRDFARRQLIREPWIDVAQWIHGNTPPDATIAGMEIGLFGYTTDRRWIDLAGLTDREVAALPGPLHHRADPALIDRREPDYLLLVLREVDGTDKGLFVFDAAILSSDALRAYEEVMEWPRAEPDMTDVRMVLYRRKDAR